MPTLTTIFEQHTPNFKMWISWICSFKQSCSFRFVITNILEICFSFQCSFFWWDEGTKIRQFKNKKNRKLEVELGSPTKKVTNPNYLNLLTCFWCFFFQLRFYNGNLAKILKVVSRHPRLYFHLLASHANPHYTFWTTYISISECEFPEYLPSNKVNCCFRIQGGGTRPLFAYR